MAAEDPCAVLAELEAARRKLLMGARATRVSYRSGDVERDVRYAPADLQALEAEIRKFTDLCNAATGQPRVRRFAFRAG